MLLKFSHWNISVLVYWQGRPSPKASDAYSPYFRTCFRVYENCLQWPFLQNNFCLFTQISIWPFFSHHSKFLTFPLFSQNVYIFPLFRKKPLHFLLFLYTFPYVRSIYVFCFIYVFWLPPILTMMHLCTLHVLDAPVYWPPGDDYGNCLKSCFEVCHQVAFVFDWQSALIDIESRPSMAWQSGNMPAEVDLIYCWRTLHLWDRLHHSAER